jgi:hypothetical protein
VLSDIPRPEYPRPQFVRDDWLCLNGTWQFERDPGDSGIDRGLLQQELTGDAIDRPALSAAEDSGQHAATSPTGLMGALARYIAPAHRSLRYPGGNPAAAQALLRNAGFKLGSKAGIGLQIKTEIISAVTTDVDTGHFDLNIVGDTGHFSPFGFYGIFAEVLEPNAELVMLHLRPR